MDSIIEVTIVNWQTYNPRKDRSVHSWFRFQNNFFSDQKLYGLSESHRMIFIFLLCEASKSLNGAVNVNVKYIAQLMQYKESLILEAFQTLVNIGVITSPNGNLNSPIGNTTNVTNERTNVTNTSTSVDSRSRKEVGEKWNTEIRECPKFRGWPKTRDDAAKRFLEQHSIADWLEVLKKINESDFLSGKEKKFRATIDWALKPANAAKILEGNYENRSGGKSDSSEDDAKKILEGIKKFSSHESEKLKTFLGDGLFRSACRIPGGISGIRAAPSGPFAVKNLVGLLKEVKP